MLCKHYIEKEGVLKIKHPHLFAKFYKIKNYRPPAAVTLSIRPSVITASTASVSIRAT